MLPQIAALTSVPQSDRHRVFDRGGFKFFVQQFWEVLHDRPLFDAPYVDALTVHLENVLDLKRLVIRKPRKIGASQITSVFFPAWWWGCKDPSAKFLCASYSKEIAVDLSIRCRQLIESEEFQFCFGHRVKLDVSKEDFYTTTKQGQRIAASVESATLSRASSFVICDDMNGLHDTEADRARTVQYFDGVLVRCIIPGKPSAIINLQQTTHAECLANTLLQRNAKLEEGGVPWHDLCLPFDASDDDRMHRDCPLWTDDRKPGEPIVPEGFFDPADLAMWRSDRFDWEKQSNQNPVSDSGAWVTTLPYYTIRKGLIECGSVTIDPADGVRFACTDLAMRKDNHNDYSVWQTWLAYDRYLVLLFNWRGKLEWNDLKRQFVEFYRGQAPSFVVVEANGPQKLAADELGRLMTVKPYDPKSVSKWDRAAKARVRIDNKEMWFPKDVDLARELLNFSPKAKHDDMVDCVSQAAIFGQGVAKRKPPTEEELAALKQQRHEAERKWYEKHTRRLMFGRC